MIRNFVSTATNAASRCLPSGATVAAMLLCCVSAYAADTDNGFEDPAMDARYRELIREIRCMKCQNQTIADSPIAVAADLRRQVHDMMSEGQSDAEIKTYLASRYGDFILYMPPVKPTTWALWGAPAALLLLGGFVFARVIRNRALQPFGEDDDS